MKAKHGWDGMLMTDFFDTITSSEIFPSFQDFHKNYNKLMQMRMLILLLAVS